MGNRPHQKLEQLKQLGSSGCLDAIVYLKLTINALDMSFDRIDRDDQFASNLRIGLSRDKQTQYLLFLEA